MLITLTATEYVAVLIGGALIGALLTGRMNPPKE